MQKNKYAISLLNKGIIVIPILPKSKIPPATLKKWDQLNDSHIKTLIKKWEPLKDSSYNLAVVTNYTGRIVCLDFDTYKPKVRDYYESVKDQLPSTYTELTARGGYHYFYKISSPQSSRKVTDCYELRADKNYTLIAPSQYLDDETKELSEYSVISDIPLDPQQLPELPDFFKSHHEPKKTITTHKDLDHNHLSQALSYIPSDDRDTWIKVAAALKYESQDLFETFVNWSKRSDKFKSEDDCRKTWDSFNKDGLTIATIFTIAEEHGYPLTTIAETQNYQTAKDLFTVEETDTAYSSHTSPVDSRILNEPSLVNKLKYLIETTKTLSKAEQIRELQKDDDDFYYSAPCTIGKLTKELCNLARNPQPSITFATLLATTGYLKAGHYKTSDEDNAWHPTNFISCFAPTSSGKGFAQDIILEVLTNFQRLSGIVDNFKSVPALVGTLKNAPNHNIFQQLDEASSFFRAPSEKTPAYLEDLLPELTKLWSKADSVYISSGTKKEKFKDRAEIHGPKINILNFSQPDALYSLSGSQLVYSGLLPRFIFFVDERLGSVGRQGKVRPPKNLIKFLEKYNDLYLTSEFTLEPATPEQIANQAIDKPVSHQEAVKHSEREINQDHPTTAPASTYRIVTLSNEARRIYQDYEQEVFKKRQTLRQRHDPLNDMLGKAAELAGRVAVTLSDSDTIEGDLMLWATQLIDRSIAVSFVALSDISLGVQYRKFTEFEASLLSRLKSMQVEAEYRPISYRRFQQAMGRGIANIGGADIFKRIISNLNDLGAIKLFNDENKKGPTGKLISLWSDSLDN